MSGGFNSDPDIFISQTNMFPTTANNSQQYCMKQGSDTCVITPSTVAIADTFYIGVRCVEQCVYGLIATYLYMTPLVEAAATLDILNGHTSDLF